ncbi:MAG: methyltransferase domain-containing protein [Pseudomonadota bacterium]
MASASSSARPQATGLGTWSQRARYVAQQGARVTWYAGQAYRMRRMQQQAIKADPTLKPDVTPPSKKAPGVPELLRGVAALSRRDLANIEAGLYPAPPVDETWPERFRNAQAFFKDVPEVARRRAQKRHQEAREAPNADKRPRYYQQNFHFQTDGWMSKESATLYDTQVEVLFSGATSTMRRMGLVPVADFMRGKDQRTMRAADLATGPGNFAQTLSRAYPRLPITALDLSEPYTRHAINRFKSARHHTGMVAKAEDMPFGDASLDLASCVFLFHELPPKIRVAVAQEIARVLKPGGLFVFVDSLQPGDTPAYDGLLELFPQLFHEPYYTSYAATDLVALFSEAGLTPVHQDTAFFSKILAFEKAQ